MSEPVFSAQGGLVLHRGVYLPLWNAEPLLARLKGQPWAAEIAAQLETAITEVTRPSDESRAVEPKERH